MAVGEAGIALRIFATAGTIADCSKALALIEGSTAKQLLGDKGYDTNAIIEAALAAGMEVVIPPMKSRKVQRDYDKETYRWRRLVENAFLHLKRWRGIATRYAKATASFLASVQIRSFLLWAEHSLSLSRVNTP